MIERRAGVVSSILERRPGATEISVSVDGRDEKALNYDFLTGSVDVGDRVLLNTTAVTKNLGTGGYHFVIAVNENKEEKANKSGHIIKMRYTPFQINVLSIEEDSHPENAVYRSVSELGGTPVVAGSLHSMIAPIAAAVKYTAGFGIKVAYLMTDGAALPIWLSKLVHGLKNKKLIDFTITCGHAFGGDYEAVNVYSGLLCARVKGADVIIASMGPGIVGTSTEYGNTALEQGEIINAVNVLGGYAIAIPRISFADSRSRHYGLSHHTRTALGKVALSSCTVVLPFLCSSKKTIIDQQLNESGILKKHKIVELDTKMLEKVMDYYKISVTTMGRSIKEDPDFFHTSFASGIYAGRLLKSGFHKTSDCSGEKTAASQNMH
ncbi:MAG: DUF3866 family protein [Bacillota bacterium]